MLTTNDIHNKLYTKNTINNYSFEADELYSYLKEFCDKDNIPFDKDKFIFCYLTGTNNFILYTTDYLYFINPSKTYINYLSIPVSRILNVFFHHRWTLGDFIVIDLSTNDYEFIVTYNLISCESSQDIVDMILSNLNQPYSNDKTVFYKYTTKKGTNTLKESPGIFFEKKTVELIKNEHKHWFTSSINERINTRNSKLTNLQISSSVHTENLDYNNMSIEELQSQIEKEKLIAELKKLKGENDDCIDIPNQNKKNSDYVSHQQYNYTSPKKAKKELIKENKSKGIACCPKCGSTSITTTDKKLSITRGIVGGAILGPIGAGVGALTSKKIYCVCLTCGHRWKI